MGKSVNGCLSNGLVTCLWYNLCLKQLLLESLTSKEVFIFND